MTELKIQWRIEESNEDARADIERGEIIIIEGKRENIDNLLEKIQRFIDIIAKLYKSNII